MSGENEPQHAQFLAPPTAEQVELMADPCALVIARRINDWSAWSTLKPPKTFFRYLELVECDPLRASETMISVFLTRLVKAGVLREQPTQDGRGRYYVKTPHTWPWVQVTLAEHKDT